MGYCDEMNLTGGKIAYQSNSNHYVLLAQPIRRLTSFISPTVSPHHLQPLGISFKFDSDILKMPNFIGKFPDVICH
jgi:hypothetical protein